MVNKLWIKQAEEIFFEIAKKVLRIRPKNVTDIRGVYFSL